MIHPAVCIQIVLHIGCMVLCAVLHRRYRVCKKRYGTQRHLAEQRLRLIRSMLDLCYVYSESPQVFHEKFKDKVNIRQLKCYDLIEIADKRYEGLKEDERMLCALFESGFSQRELCTVYNVRKLSTMYVKYYRIKSKLERHSKDSEHCPDASGKD